MKKILDVGCSDGHTLMLHLDRFQCFGIDPDVESIGRGLKLYPNLHLTVGVAENLPYHDQSFDALLCYVALPYMDIRRAISEFHRVTKPGASIELSMHNLGFFIDTAKRIRKPRHLAFEIYKLLNTAAISYLGRPFRYPLNRERLESYQTTRMMLSILKDKFQPIEIENEYYYFRIRAQRF